MRLALIHRTLSTHGGTERYVLGFAGFLIEKGHEVTVFCSRPELVPDGVSVERLEERGRGRLFRMLSLHRATAALEGEGHLQGFHDVFGFMRGVGHRIYRAGGGCHAAWIEARGGWAAIDALETRFDRQAVSEAELVVVNSEMAGRDLERFYGTPAARLRLVRNGVDLVRFCPDGPVDETLPGPAVCFLGTGFLRKGLASAIKAVAPIDGLQLVVVGVDASPGRYLRLAEGLGMADRLHLLGARKDPENVLRHCEALILPTRYDPFANATLEALACGVPVVTTQRNGAHEVLPEPWMAVGEPDDHGALNEALERALHERRTTDLAARCRRRAEEFPAQRSFAELLALSEETRP